MTRILLLLLFMGSFGMAAAQTDAKKAEEAVDISILVLDSSGSAPLPWVQVELSQMGAPPVTASTNAIGKVKLTGVREGFYTVILSRKGWDTWSPGVIAIVPGEPSDFIWNYDFHCPFDHPNAQKGICPQGHKDEVVPIVYGFPTEETFEDAEAGLVKLGGCEISDCDPQWYCNKHQCVF